MIYKISVWGTVLACKWVILSTVILAPFLFKALLSNDSKSVPLLLFLIFVWALFSVPQLFLILQYLRAPNYTSFEIDKYQKRLIISQGSKKLVRDFSDLKRTIHFKPHFPIYFGSLWLTICMDLYYYRFDFEEESYYLTSVAFPSPVFDGEKIFYETFIEKKVVFANIRKH